MLFKLTGEAIVKISYYLFIACESLVSSASLHLLSPANPKQLSLIFWCPTFIFWSQHWSFFARIDFFRQKMIFGIDLFLVRSPHLQKIKFGIKRLILDINRSTTWLDQLMSLFHLSSIFELVFFGGAFDLLCWCPFVQVILFLFYFDNLFENALDVKFERIDPLFAIFEIVGL